MKQHLAVSAIGSDRTGMVHDLTRVISDCGGSISESRMASLGNEFAMLVLVSGNWHSLAKLESELTRLGEATGLSLHMKRTEPRAPRTELLPYSIDVVCLDQAGIVTGLSGFCASRGIDIAEVSTRTYPAAHTGAQMFAVQMIINVPKRLQLAHLREEFMDYCDAQNLDAILEPVKVLTAAVGKKIPAFSLPRSDGTLWKSTDATFPLVLYFYPKDMTPGCTLEGQDFRDLHAAFKRAKTTVLGVSKDSCSAHAKFRAKEKFQFELLSDEDEKVCRLFDVIREKSLYGRKFMGIERSTFLIDAAGKLAREWRKVRVKGHAAEVLEAAKSL